MDMVAADARAGTGDNGSDGGVADSGDGANGDLPRAGELMSGVKRQSQTLAVFIGLEDAPDAPSGERIAAGE